MAPSSPTISSYENLLRTPTPPKVTAVPEDILQVSFSKLDIRTSATEPVISRRADALVRVLITSEFRGPGPPGTAWPSTGAGVIRLTASWRIFSSARGHFPAMATLSTVSMGGVAGKARNAVYPAVPRVGCRE